MLYRSLTVLSLCIAQFICIGFFGEGLVSILRQDGFSLERVGALRGLGLFAVLAFLWSPFIDAIALKIGGYKKIILAFQCLTLAILYAVSLLNPRDDLPAVIALAVLLAFISATWTMTSNAFFIKISNSSNLSFTNALKLSGGLIGHVSGNGLTLVIYAKFGWSEANLFLTSLIAVSLLSLAFFKEPERVNAGEGLDFRAMFGFFKGKKAWLSVLFVQSIGICAAFGLLSPMLVDIGWKLEDIGEVLHIYGTVFGFAGALAAGFAVKKLGAKRAFLYAVAMQTLGILAIWLPIGGWTDRASVLFASSAAYAVYMAQATIISTMMMQRASGRRPASEYAVQSSLNMTFQIFSFYLGTLLAGTLGYGAVVLGAAAFCVLSLVYFIKIYKFI